MQLRGNENLFSPGYLFKGDAEDPELVYYVQMAYYTYSEIDKDQWLVVLECYVYNFKETLHFSSLLKILCSFPFLSRKGGERDWMYVCPFTWKQNFFFNIFIVVIIPNNFRFHCRFFFDNV